MDKDRAIQTLREHEKELRAAGIVRIRLFGSTARGDARDGSDIDLMADFDKSKRLTLVSIGSIQERLTRMLGAEVDLTSPEWMKQPIRDSALEEAVVAF